MAKTRRILPILLLIAILGVISWLVLRPHDLEPIYHGKPLTYWLDGLSPANRNTPPTSYDAEEAVQHIGTNAIPTLLRLLKTKDSKFKSFFIQLTQRQHLLNLKWNTARSQHLQAQAGFRYLGPEAKSAVRMLIEIYNQRPSGQDNDALSVIPSVFAAMGPAAADAVSQLSQDTADADRYIRFRAAWALGQIHARSDLAVPALTRSLCDSVSNVRTEAAISLGAFDSDAQSANPELIKALADPDPDVRTAAAAALKQINPYVVANPTAQ